MTKGSPCLLIEHHSGNLNLRAFGFRDCGIIIMRYLQGMRGTNTVIKLFDRNHIIAFFFFSKAHGTLKLKLLLTCHRLPNSWYLRNKTSVPVFFSQNNIYVRCFISILRRQDQLCLYNALHSFFKKVYIDRMLFGYADYKST